MKEVEKSLGEPVAADFSEYVRKLRGNLVFVSFLSISLIIGGLEIESTSSILGLKFKGLDNAAITSGLLILNGYMLVHFLWCSIDAFQEWGLRVTGTRLSFVTTAKLGSIHGDYPSDPRQSSLYNWWKDEAGKIGSLADPITEIVRKLEIWETEVKRALNAQGNTEVVSACNAINKVSTDIKQLQRSIVNASQTVESRRIPESLKRFDNRFQLFLRSQNLRWLLLELGLPIITGAVAVYLLASKL